MSSFVYYEGLKVQELSYFDVVSKLAKYDRTEKVYANMSGVLNPVNVTKCDFQFAENTVHISSPLGSEEKVLTVGELILILLHNDLGKKALITSNDLSFGDITMSSIAGVRKIGNKVIILNAWYDGSPMYW